MNSKGATEVKVGIAVGAALLLFIVTVVLLGGNKSMFSSTYILKVPFDHVDGLNPGSLVRVNGYQVGSVHDIQFSAEDQKIIVYVKILKKFQSRITKDSEASLRTQGALGDKYVAIETLTFNGEPLKDGDSVRVEESPDIFTTISQRSGDLGKIFDILKDFREFSKTLNKDGRSDHIMENLTSASKHMDQAMVQFELAIKDLRGDDQKNLKKISNHIESILEKIDNGNGTLGELINDPTIHDKIKEILGGSKRNDYMKSLIQKTIQEGKK